MGDEIAHTSGGDYISSNVVNKDFLNSHAHGAASATLKNTHGEFIEGRVHLTDHSLGHYLIRDVDTADSSLSNSAATTNSTELHATRFINQSSSSRDIARASGNLDTGGKPVEILQGPGRPDFQNPRKLPDSTIGPTVPSRTSSDPKLYSSGLLPLEQPTLSDQEKGSRRGSKSSVSGIARKASVSSSHSKRRQNNTASPNEPVISSLNPTIATKPERTKKKGVSRFLSLLNCCSAPESAHPVDPNDQNVPARKTSKLQPSHGRQATPVPKPDVSAAESSTAESKEAPDEKVIGPTYTNTILAGSPRIQDQPEEALAPARTLNPIFPADSDHEGNSPIQRPTETDGVQPSSSVTSQEAATNQAKQSTLQSPVTRVLVEPPTPTTPIQDAAINDRTPQQEKRDSDIEMVDAPAIEPEQEEPSINTERRQAESLQPLPPPPPIASSDPQSATNVGTDQPSSNMIASNEKQQWLLPPIQPRFKGKKCLVLDLDETLVHSSFKVGKPL